MATCDVCNKAFSRAEHLERHKRTHTQEKPYPCPYCSRSFQRSDVRSLHIRNGHWMEASAVANPAPTTTLKRKRVRIACEGCRKRKLRCDGEEPCLQCRYADQACQYRPSGMFNPTYDASVHASVAPTTPVGLERTEPEWQATADGIVPCSGGASGQQAADCIPPNLLADAICEVTRDDDIFVGSFDINPSIAQPATLLPFDDRTGSTLPGDFWLPEFDLAYNDDAFSFSLPDGTSTSSSTRTYSQSMLDYFSRRALTSSSQTPSNSVNNVIWAWHASPKSLSDHDLDILNVFLNIFRRNVPCALPLFQDISIDASTRVDFILAIAAIGGLYCRIKGSFELSKAMYNDSRRRLLTSIKSPGFYDNPDRRFSELLIIVKTFILHEIYGPCSGDKRSYELAEGFHQYVIQAFQALAKRVSGMKTGMDNKDMARVIETMCILDCYRVVLFQRPPTFLSPDYATLSVDVTSPGPAAAFRGLVADIANPGSSVDGDRVRTLSLASLSALSPAIWQAVLLGPTPDHISISPWKSDFVELALHKWLRSHHNDVEPATRVLYHLINITLNINPAALRSFAHSPVADTVGSSASHDVECFHSGIVKWFRGRQGALATWNAEQLMDCAEAAGKLKSSIESDSGAVWTAIDHSVASSGMGINVVHVPYAVYHATLVLWCRAAVLDARNARSRQAHLTRGMYVLSGLDLRIASLLERALGRIQARVTSRLSGESR